MIYRVIKMLVFSSTLMIAVPVWSAPLAACDLATKEIIEQTSKLTITNVTAKDRNVFTSCTYETNDWQQSIGLIYYPGVQNAKDSTSLAAQLQAEFKRDEAPYTTPEPLANVGDAAVYYQSSEGDYHAIVILSSSKKINGRLVVSGPSRTAAMAVAGAIVANQ